jgi:hypothetical protein
MPAAKVDRLTGAAGEHYVCSMLAGYGWAPSSTRDGLARTDLLAVHSGTRRLIEVQVKNVRTGHWMLGLKGLSPDVSGHEWYVFVQLGVPPATPVASRMPVSVENDVSVGRLPAAVGATAYFVVGEALTNVTKRARAEHAAVTTSVEDGTLRVQVRDDGVGDARPDGSGLLGLADRLAVLDGQLRIESPADGGTFVAADIPVPG